MGLKFYSDFDLGVMVRFSFCFAFLKNWYPVYFAKAELESVCNIALMCFIELDPVLLKK